MPVFFEFDIQPVNFYMSFFISHLIYHILPLVHISRHQYIELEYSGGNDDLGIVY